MNRITVAAMAVMMAIATVAAAPITAHARGAGPPWATCVAQSVTVPLSATNRTKYTISGHLCRPNHQARGATTVLMMVSGLTYDHRYFDSRYQPERYSWVWAATRHGYGRGCTGGGFARGSDL